MATQLSCITHWGVWFWKYCPTPKVNSWALQTKHISIDCCKQTVLHLELNIPDVPNNVSSFDYGDLNLKGCLSWEHLLDLIEKPVLSESPLMMEMLPINELTGQAYGFLLYRAEFRNGQRIKIVGRFRDRAVVGFYSGVHFVNCMFIWRFGELRFWWTERCWTRTSCRAALLIPP